MYYVLDYDIPQDENGGYPDIDDDIEIEGVISWSIGKRFEVEIPQPIEINLSPVEGYAGEPPPIYEGQILILKKELVEALQDAGVNNIDTYNVVVRNVNSGHEYNYKAVNIIGAIAAADLEESEWESYDDDPLFDVSFDSLVIDEEKAKGHKLFRLAEHTGTIIIHESVKDSLIERGFDYLDFIDPEEYCTI